MGSHLHHLQLATWRVVTKIVGFFVSLALNVNLYCIFYDVLNAIFVKWLENINLLYIFYEVHLKKKI